MMMPISIFISKYYHSQSLASQLCQRDSQWFRVDVAHQFSYVLFLPPQRAVRFHLARFHDGLQQIFIERQAFEIGELQCNKLFAQFLQRDIFAFSCAFAGL